MKIVSIVGARPQFVKLAAICRALNDEHIIIHTGQHYDYMMSDVFFQEMDIPEPDYNLNIGSHARAQQVGKMIIGIADLLDKIKPDYVLLYGDTNSTLAGAVASDHCTVHIEAGVRCYCKMVEEKNRILTDHACDILFAPNQRAANNLQSEGLQGEMFGDVMLDSFNHYWPKRKESEFSDFYLATIHRKENMNRLGMLLSLLDGLDKKVIFPAHPRLNIKSTKNIQVIEPVSYLTMLGLLDACSGVWTDSGGLQRECYFGKKCVSLLRDNQEWLDGYYGDGDAGIKMIKYLRDDFNNYKVL